MAHDIFISYAHVDNEPMPGASEGWVTTLVTGLRQRLCQELGRKDAYQMWMDYELRGNDSVTPAIYSHLDQAGHLVLFLSKGYVSSSWCMEELNRFVKRMGTNSKRIFTVYLAPVCELPPALTDQKKYIFWSEDPTGRPRTMGIPIPDPTQREYYDLVEDLARDLATMITASRLNELPTTTPANARNEVKVEVRNPSTSISPPTQQDNQPPSDATGNLQPPTKQQMLFVDAGQDDFSLVRNIGEFLKARGYGYVIPLQALPGFDPASVRPTELRKDLRQNLKICDAVVMLYRTGPVNQVREHIIAWRGAAARRKTASPPLQLFQEAPDPLVIGMSYPGMQVCVVPSICPEECMKHLSDQENDSGDHNP